jgi:hypothetical protein
LIVDVSAVAPAGRDPQFWGELRETIESDLVDLRKPDRRRNTLLDSCLQRRKKVGQFAPVTADESVLHIFLLPDSIEVATMSND